MGGGTGTRRTEVEEKYTFEGKRKVKTNESGEEGMSGHFTIDDQRNNSFSGHADIHFFAAPANDPRNDIIGQFIQQKDETRFIFFHYHPWKDCYWLYDLQRKGKQESDFFGQYTGKQGYIFDTPPRVNISMVEDAIRRGKLLDLVEEEKGKLLLLDVDIKISRIKSTIKIKNANKRKNI